MSRLVPLQGSPGYRQLWRIVDGAVRDTFNAHPDYLSPRGRRKAEAALVKRITGAVFGYAVAAADAAAQGRSGFSPAAESEAAAVVPAPPAEPAQRLRLLAGCHAPVSPIHADGPAYEILLTGSA